VGKVHGQSVQAKGLGREPEWRQFQDESPGALFKRAALAPASLDSADLLNLQRSVGNRAVGQLLAKPASGRPRAVIQAKLTVNAPGDEYEREADRIARQIADRLDTTEMPVTLPRPGPCDAQAVRCKHHSRSQVDRGVPATAHLEAEVRRELGCGQPLGEDTRSTMEHAFGADFSGVRVHTGHQADKLAGSIQALAFTTGHDVFFRHGAYRPDNPMGRELLAHELTHVVQQRGGIDKPSPAVTSRQTSRLIQRNGDDDLGSASLEELRKREAQLGSEMVRLESVRIKQSGIEDISELNTILMELGPPPIVQNEKQRRKLEDDFKDEVKAKFPAYEPEKKDELGKKETPRQFFLRQITLRNAQGRVARELSRVSGLIEGKRSPSRTRKQKATRNHKGSESPKGSGSHKEDLDSAGYSIKLPDKLKPEERGVAEPTSELFSEFFSDLDETLDFAAGVKDRQLLREEVTLELAEYRSEASGVVVEPSPGWRTDRPDNTQMPEWTAKHGADVAAGTMGSLSSLIGIGLSIDKLSQGKMSGLWGLTSNVASVTANTAKMVDSGYKLNEAYRGGYGETRSYAGSIVENSPTGANLTTASDITGKATGNVADFIGIIDSAKEVFLRFKDLWDAWIKHKKKQASRGEIARAGVNYGLSILNMMRDAMSTVRNLLFTLENAWNVALSSAVPILGAVINGLFLCLHGYDAVRAHMRRAKMREEKRNMKIELWGHRGGEENRPELLKHKRIGEIREELQSNRQNAAGPGKGFEEQLRIIENYEIARELQTINRKQSDRQELNISTDLLKIVGEIGTATGVGATVGIGFKAGAAGVSLAATARRSVAQAAKDRGWFGYDTEKYSRDAKHKRREQLAFRIYDRMKELERRSKSLLQRNPGDFGYTNEKDELLEEHRRLMRFVRATGMSWKVLVHYLLTAPEVGHELFMKALARR
jgi:hypothetical protein